MKILVIHHSDEIGGGTLSAIDLINSIKDNHHVKFVLPLRKNAAKEISSSNNIEVSQVGLKPPIFTFYNGGPNLYYSILQFIKRIFGYRTLNKIIKFESPDLIILNSIILWPLIKMLNKKKIKNLIFIRETMKNRREYWLNKIIIRNLNIASGVSFLSRYDKDKWSIKNENQVVIHDVVKSSLTIQISEQISLKNHLGLDESEFVVLYTGGDNEIKGPQVAIDTMRILKNEGLDKIKLLFLGNFEITRKNYDLPDNIIFKGIQKDMITYFTVSDVIIFPAIKAHQTRLIYEAGAFKKTVIATDYLNYSEFLIDNHNGLIFKEGSSNELANKIKYLYVNRNELNRLGYNNYLMTLKNHDIRQMSEKINDFIMQVVK